MIIYASILVNVILIDMFCLWSEESVVAGSWVQVNMWSPKTTIYTEVRHKWLSALNEIATSWDFQYEQIILKELNDIKTIGEPDPSVVKLPDHVWDSRMLEILVDNLNINTFTTIQHGDDSDDNSGDHAHDDIAPSAMERGRGDDDGDVIDLTDEVDTGASSSIDNPPTQSQSDTTQYGTTEFPDDDL